MAERTDSPLAPQLAEELKAGAADLMEEAVAVRRSIHSHPELGLELPRTQELVAGKLEALGLTPTLGQGCSSLVAVLEGEREGPTTLLRADMDALEMPEDTGLEFASGIRGRMHACGHDAHTAMLLGAARLLHDRRQDLAGRVVLMFQPGEEGHDGARVMLEEGLMSKYGDVDRAFAIHITAAMPNGWLSTRPGTLMASADEFQVTVTGRGGHASMPHDATDPVPAAAEIIMSVQAMVTRAVPAFDPAVVTVSMVHGGTATNVIPAEVVLGGTIRAVSDQSRDKVIKRFGELVTLVASAHDCRAELEIMPGNYPVTINDPAFAAHTLQVARSLVGNGSSLEMPTPVMGAEDWSRVLRQVPGSMAFLGACPPGETQPAPNHSNHFVIDEGAMATGIAMYSAMALVSS